MIPVRLQLVFSFWLLLLACRQPETPSSRLLTRDSLRQSRDTPTTTYRIRPNGKLQDILPFNTVYSPAPLDTFSFPQIDAEILAVLEQQKRLLRLRKQKSVHHVGDLSINVLQLEETVSMLERWQHILPIGIHEHLEAWQLWGKDRMGNVQFTGYFAPVIKVSAEPTERFRYPIYERPHNWERPYPTRKEIESGALTEQGLELAYAENKVDIYFMQVQGSGYVEFPNGRRQMLAYNGTNRHPYRSVGTYLKRHPEYGATNFSMDGIKRFLQQNPELTDSILAVNPSYTFFKARRVRPEGAGHVPLTAECSIAVDDRYIPLGSCLLAAIPEVNKRGQVTHHSYRLLFAQDVGGAIRGPGHVDLYCGVGEVGKRRAQYFNHYGRLWLLLPRQKETAGPVFTSLEIGQ